jgi:hypothetical protein
VEVEPVFNHDRDHVVQSPGQVAPHQVQKEEEVAAAPQHPAAPAEEAEEHHQARALTANDKDREAFVTMVNSLFWDADEEETVTGTDAHARNFVRQFQRRGLFGMKMPDALRDESSYTGEMYRGFIDQCYDVTCSYGLGGLASSLSNFFG